jgi:hypothetical protein
MSIKGDDYKRKLVPVVEERIDSFDKTELKSWISRLNNCIQHFVNRSSFRVSSSFWWSWYDVCMIRYSCRSFTRYCNRYIMRMCSFIRCCMSTHYSILSRFIRVPWTSCISLSIIYIVVMVSRWLSSSIYSELINNMRMSSIIWRYDVDIVYVRLDWVYLFT